MKIYTVYENKIHELEVTETKKMFIAEDYAGLAFHCQRRFYKEECSLSPKEAVGAAINRKLTMIGAHKDKLVKLEADLYGLRLLSKEIGPAAAGTKDKE